MITQEIEYHAPPSLVDVIALLDDEDRHVELLAGGMSLVPTMTLGLAHPEVLISLKRVPDLSYTRLFGDDLCIGAATTHAEITASAEVLDNVPVLAECASLIGDVQIRNRGTLGGSLAHADPAANYPPLALALGASMVIRSAAGERVVRAADFFEGVMQTAVAHGDVLTEVRIPVPESGEGAAYREFVRVEGNFALVNACAVVSSINWAGRVALGGIASVPVSVGLAGLVDAGILDTHGLDAAVDEMTLGAFADINGSVEYKRSLARTFARRAVDAAIGRAARTKDEQ